MDSINMKGMPAAQFKAMLKAMQEEQKNRGPSGAPRLPDDTVGADALVSQVTAFAKANDADLIEVLDLVLRKVKSKFYLSTKARKEDTSESTT